MLKCTSAVCVLTYGEGCKSGVRNASVRIDLGDEVRVRALTGPEAVPGARDLSLRHEDEAGGIVPTRS